jgi:hypothetical protein
LGGWSPTRSTSLAKGASICKDAFVRTTIEFPNELFRQVKMRAAQDGTTLKKLVTTYVEQGLRREASSAPEPPRQRSPIPVARASTGQPLPALSNAKLQQILVEEDLARELES